ncbi:neurogenic locus notch homolog protein 2-like isoform X2 [Ruditapes philippinarum]|uniref:neurogenic locus notch homolog protein 2-like isoform X2 n=1 Tax=Ruditapes philippinarum TaxID=129788 RepID=UPI00295AFD3E|nr:neurogenic locus notch homolog protein 2-like isoform X2 [Ruditapes philippinarum]
MTLEVILKMKTLILLLILGYFIADVKGQIGVTGCTVATQANCPNFLPNSYCNLGSMLCECPAGYTATLPNVACEYNCGNLTDPDNGLVTTPAGTHTGDVATYTCFITFEVVGTATRTCQQDTGWDGAAPTCEPAELGDACSTNIFQCNNIANAGCVAFSTCQCNAGYEDDGTGLACTDIDECTPNQCQNSGTCVDGINAYTCTCLPGYNGDNCENDIDECTPNQCQNGATCVDGINAYTCTCVAGYEGINCQTNINECIGNVCQNGATCVDGINQYTCTCVAGYDGNFCQNNINECASHACQNGATCVDGINTYTCICVAGYDGNFCDKNIDDCATSPCQNGGTCQDAVNDYTCVCVAGYTDKNCQTNINECESHACNNGATCVDRVNAYECVCAAGWEGTFCTSNINECESNQCQNGAICVDGIDDYTCDCVNGYNGIFCQNNINECLGHACENGATCVDGINQYTCTCVAGYTGEFCATIKIEDVAVCTRDTDNRGTIWENTPVGLVVNNSCGEDFIGHITRACSSDGIWQLPVYNCIRDSVQNIRNVVDALSNTSEPENFNTVLADIVSATVQRENATEKLTNGEMKLLTTSLKTIATVLPPQLVINESILDSFFESVGNIIDNNNSDTWRSEQESTSAVQLVSAVDQIAETLSENLQPGEKRNIRNANIALQAQTLAESKIVYPDENMDIEWLNTISSKIELQPQAFNDVTDQVIATAVVYRNLSGILPNTYSKNAGKGSSEKNRINGAILAMTIPSEYSARQLNPPISITFEHFDKTLSSPICVYWQKESESQGIWSDDGCELISTSNDVTVCECEHLTNFAVLMSPIKQTEESAWDLRIISMVCLSLSTLCLVATIVLHFTFWKRLRSQRTTVMIHLCVCLIVAYLVFLIGINKTEHQKLCTAIAVFLHYIFLVVFGIMFLQGLQIVIAVQYVFKTRLNLKILLVMAWSLPAFIVGISIALSKLKGYGNKKLCWLTSDNWLIWSFVGPAIAVISFNAICLCLVIRAIFRTRAMQTKPVGKRVKTSIWALCVLLPLLGITWIVEVFYIDGNSEFLQYIFAILNGLQGFFIFLFHCALNRQVKKAMGEQRIKKVSKKFTQDVVV